MTAIGDPHRAPRGWASARRVGPLVVDWRGERSAATWRDDVVTVGIGGIGAVAMYWDSWRHNGEAIESDNFWSPPHILLYVSLTVVAGWIGLIVLRHQQAGSKAINLARVPRGYGIGLVGIALATVGGIGDFIWHANFGLTRSGAHPTRCCSSAARWWSWRRSCRPGIATKVRSTAGAPSRSSDRWR